MLCSPLLVKALVLGASVLMATTPSVGAGDLDDEIESLNLAEAGMELGIQVMLEGRGVIYSRAAAVPRSAASSIKTAIALDLFSFWGDQLDQVPIGLGSLLRPGTHPAFAGFTTEELDEVRTALMGKSYTELARIMMGRTGDSNAVYNAACNVIMVKLGGPEAIGDRLRSLDAAFADIHLDRYMQSWNGDGDNAATPEALVNLYSMTSSGHISGLAEKHLQTLRSLLREDPAGGPGQTFEKVGTLYPDPMVRVHAGYVEREAGNLVYAVMGEIPSATGRDPADDFAMLLSAVDQVARLCRDLVEPEQH